MFGRFLKFLSIISIITNFGVFANLENQYKNIAVQWGMRAQFHKILNNPELDDYEDTEWIKNKKYKDSIYKVIPKCIADCVTKQNEFFNIDSIKLKKGDIIEFAIKPYDKQYTMANWNALVLYNLVAEMFYGEHRNKFSDTIYDIGQKIKKYYHFLNCASYIDSAVYSLKKYNEILAFYDTGHRLISNQFIPPIGLYRNSYDNFAFTIKDIEIKILDNLYLTKTDLMGRYSDGELKFYIFGDCEVEVNEYFNVTKILKKGDLSSGNYAKYLLWTKCNFKNYYKDAINFVNSRGKDELNSDEQSKFFDNIKKCKKSIIDWEFLNTMKQDFLKNYKEQYEELQKLTDVQSRNYREHCIVSFLAYTGSENYCGTPLNTLCSKYIQSLFDVCKFSLNPSEYEKFIEQALDEISAFEKERYMRLKVLIQHYLPSFYAKFSHLL